MSRSAASMPPPKLRGSQCDNAAMVLVSTPVRQKPATDSDSETESWSSPSRQWALSGSSCATGQSPAAVQNAVNNLTPCEGRAPVLLHSFSRTISESSDESQIRARLRRQLEVNSRSLAAPPPRSARTAAAPCSPRLGGALVVTPRKPLLSARSPPQPGSGTSPSCVRALMTPRQRYTGPASWQPVLQQRGQVSVGRS
jgi:hypothetical protein